MKTFKTISVVSILTAVALVSCHPAISSFDASSSNEPPFVSSTINVSSGENRVIAANIYGKAKTVSQMVAIITALSFSTLSDFSVNIPYTAIINTVLLWTSTLLCVISGIIYLSENKQFVDPSK